MDLLLDDGRIRLRVGQVSPDELVTKVIEGGPISDAKGVNVPEVALPLKPLTDKDSADLDVALELGVDWVALSFVQRAKDVAEVRARVDGRAGLIAKIEKPSAIEDLEASWPSPTPSWWRGAIWGWNCPSNRCPVCKEAGARRQGCGRSRRCRHPDAGINGPRRDADPGGGVRCCFRGL